MKEFILPHSHENSKNALILKKELQSNMQFDVSAEFFKQLSDSTRVRLFWILCHSEECVINLAAMLDSSSPAISHHLRELKEFGLIVSRRDGKEVYYKAGDSEICRLLHTVLENVMEIACPVNNDSNTAIIHRVHDYLINNLDKRINLSQLSRDFLINSTTLKALFKKEYGTSLAAHIKEHRMEKACELLLKTKSSISEIAAQVGYESQSRFTEAFKDTLGFLPSEYRKGDVKNGM